MPSPRSRIGRSAEIAAAAELGRQGYVILAANYRTRLGEIDFVARDSGVIVFVEVRSKTGTSFGSPAESITPTKIHHLIAAATDYIERNELQECECRFDVIEVVLDGNGCMIVKNIIKNAFTT